MTEIEKYLLNAMETNKTVEIEYTKYHGEYSVRKISDIKPSEEFGLGYIDAYCHKRKERRTFKISRIIRVDNIGVGAMNISSSKQNDSTPKKSTYKPNASASTVINSTSSTNSRSAKPSSSSSCSSSTPSKSSEGCYVATMVYGDYNHPQVMVLRWYRDHVLKESLLGRLFIRFYYRTSPTFVLYTKKMVWLNELIRKLLDRFIEAIKAEYRYCQ